MGNRHIHDMHTCMQSTHTHKINTTIKVNKTNILEMKTELESNTAAHKLMSSIQKVKEEVKRIHMK